LQHNISLSDIQTISADLDIFIRQERETNIFATNELKEYVISKLEESFQDSKKEIDMMSINAPNDLGAVQTFSFIWNTKEEKVMQLKSLLEESKTKISSLDDKCLFEALRINYAKGFSPSCKYILEQLIIVTPKPFPGKNNLVF